MKDLARRRWLVLAAAGALVVALSGCGPTLGRPALRQPAGAPRVFDDSDPDVLVTNGHTYLFGSSNNEKLPVREITTYNNSLATSQTAWAQHPRDAMPTRPAWVNPARWQIWAPAAIKIVSTYYVYFAGHRSGAVDPDNDQCIGRAVSTSPTGPYAPEANPLYCGLSKRDVGANPWGQGALDPEVFRAHDGHLYLLAALSRTKDNIGAIELSSAGLPLHGVNSTPSILASQRFPWHDGTDNSTLSSTAFLENPSMIYDPKSKTYLLFYSAGQWFTAHYVVGFGRCTTPLGPCALDSRGPFLEGGNGRSGPGGLTAFTDAGGNLRVGYASWTAGHENTSGSVGQYSRQVTWGYLVTSGTDPATQTVSLR